MLPDEELQDYELDRADALHMAVALVMLSVTEGRLQVFMVENHGGPYAGQFALPHAIVRADEMLDQAAEAVFMNTAVRSRANIEQYYVYSCPDRDPRGRVMTVGYLGAVPRGEMEWANDLNDAAMVDIEIEAGTAQLFWSGHRVRPGFWHDEVIVGALDRLRQSIDYSLIPFSFLPEAFTLAELQEVHEAILGQPVTKAWFRKKMLKRVFEGGRTLVGCRVFRRDGPHRPAELYELRVVAPAARRKRVAASAMF